jgi:hypothetical protein
MGLSLLNSIVLKVQPDPEIHSSRRGNENGLASWQREELRCQNGRSCCAGWQRLAVVCVRERWSDSHGPIMTDEAFGNQIQLFAGDLEPMTRKPSWGSRCRSRIDQSRLGAQSLARQVNQSTLGALLNSWLIEWRGPWYAEITSDLPYAHIIEGGIGAYGPLTLRSNVGGFHSLALTSASWPRIVGLVVADYKGGRMRARMINDDDIQLAIARGS